MKEIMNNQGESMNNNQQEAGNVNSTVGYVDGDSVATLQDTPVNPALDAFYNMPSYAEINPYVVEEKKREYTGIESAFAWISFIFGYMFCKLFFNTFIYSSFLIPTRSKSNK